MLYIRSAFIGSDEDLLSELNNVSVARLSGAGINSNLQMSISLKGKSCSSLKEIQVFHNPSSKNAAYILVCSNDTTSNQKCSGSFFFREFNLCQSHSVVLRLIYNNGDQSDLLNSTIDRAVTETPLDRKVFLELGNNPGALTIQWKNKCFLVPIGDWQILIKPTATASSIIFNETIPLSCINVKSQDLNNGTGYSLVLYKDKPFPCQPTARIFQYDFCSSYSIELKPSKIADGASFYSKFDTLVTNFSTPLVPAGMESSFEFKAIHTFLFLFKIYGMLKR